VLHPVALEDDGGAVVPLDGQRHRHAAARVFGAVADLLREVDGIGRLVELAAGHAEDVGVIKLGNNSLGHGVEGLGQS